MKNQESRYLIAAELRFAPSDSSEAPPKIVGYAAVFDSMSDDLGGFREVIRPGAFAAGLASADIFALVNHDPSKILGRAKAGTLRLSEDSRGLRIEIDPPDTSVGRDTMESMRRGDMSGMSFRFRVNQGGDTWRKEPTGVVRELRSVAIDDVSVVTYPAYRDSEAAIRSLEAFHRGLLPDPWLLKSAVRLSLALAE